MAGLAKKPTPLSLRQMAEILCGTYVELYGKPLTRNLGEISLALLAVENAGGEAFIWYNWGNLTTFSGYTGDTWSTKTHTFQVQPNHRSGAKAWWRQMTRRYRNFLDFAAAGDWAGAGRAIVEDGYCPVPDCTVAGYQNAMNTWKSSVPAALETCQFSPSIPTSLAGAAPGDRVVGPVLLVFGVLSLAAFEFSRRGIL